MASEQHNQHLAGEMTSSAGHPSSQTIRSFRRNELCVVSGHASHVLSLPSSGRAKFLLPFIAALSANEAHRFVLDDKGVEICLRRIAVAVQAWIEQASAYRCGTEGALGPDELAVYSEFAQEIWTQKGPACREIVRKSFCDAEPDARWTSDASDRQSQRGNRKRISDASLVDDGQSQKRIKGAPPCDFVASFSCLPTEIHLMVIGQLEDCADRARLRMTNRYYHNLIEPLSTSELEVIRVATLRHPRRWSVCIGCIRLRPANSFCDLDFNGDPGPRLCVECGSRPLPHNATGVINENNHITVDNPVLPNRKMYFGQGFCWRNETGELWLRCKMCNRDQPRDTSKSPFVSRYCTDCTIEDTLANKRDILCQSCIRYKTIDEFSRTLTPGPLQCCLSCGVIDLPDEYHPASDNWQGSGLYKSRAMTNSHPVCFGVDYRWTDKQNTAWVRCRQCRKATRVEEISSASRCNKCAIRCIEPLY